MKVHFNPWKTIRTSGSLRQESNTSKENSLRHLSSNRKSNGAATNASIDEIVGLTFYSKKRKNAPLLTVTRPRQISALEEADHGSSWAETVQHSTGTGKASLFTVPAVRSDLGIFALQSGNKQLVFWALDSNKQIAIDLESPAIQLDLLRTTSSSQHSIKNIPTKGTPMVFGVCKNGRVFLASISSASSMQIQYLGQATTDVVSNACQLDLRGSHKQSNKRQRDGRTVLEETGVCILKCTGKTVVEVVSYVWNDAFRIGFGGTAVRTIARPLPKQISADLNNVVLLGSWTSEIVCVRVADSIWSVSRHDGRLLSRPMPIPALYNHCISMVGSGNVALLSSSLNELIIMDVRRNMIVAKETFVVATHGQAMALVTDARENRIAVISKISDNVTMILSSDIVVASEERQVRSTLALVLESAIEVDVAVRPRKIAKNNHSLIADALGEFESACTDVLIGKKTVKRKNHLIESFLSMTEKVKRVYRNGSLPIQNGEAHGNGTNGLTGMEQQPSIHPKVVGPSATLMVRLLASSCDLMTNDCRFILRNLIRTGYVSARIHLEFPDILYQCMNIPSKRNVADEEMSCYTPLEMIHDVLDHCSDVSERIMVVSLTFCMSRITDEDIMSYFRKSKRKWVGSDEMELYDRTETDTDRQALSRRIRLLSVGDLLSKMIHYSPCNDGILRHAISSEMSTKEVLLLIRILRDFRIPTGSGKTLVLPMTRSFTVWLSCSLDVVRATADSHTLLELVSTWIRLELLPMDDMFALSAMVQQRLLAEDRSTLTSFTSPAGHKNKGADRHNAAGYQIERIQL